MPTIDYRINFIPLTDEFIWHCEAPRHGDNKPEADFITLVTNPNYSALHAVSVSYSCSECVLIMQEDIVREKATRGIPVSLRTRLSILRRLDTPKRTRPNVEQHNQRD